ncbi:MAG: Asp23/Gls24 family envelope stress response protein [Clostridia bacterium]|nr:Asp23/Gls24 family envelope stress response protein [Clostridia bacterium]
MVKEFAEGKLDVAEEVVATIAGAAAIECYGLVGMASRKISDGFAELLGKESLSKGVKVHLEDNEVVIDLYIIVNYGVKISEVAHNVMEKVGYSVKNMTGLDVKAVNVVVQGVRVNPHK